MNRKRNKPKDLLNDARWTVEQDCYLIENQDLRLEQLTDVLPYTSEEIVNRRLLLGLERRAFAIKRLDLKILHEG